jgi:hypothetical protein
VIGLLNLRSGGTHLTGTDIACLVVGTAGSAAIGVAFGAITRLESRGGYLWAQLPLRGLWLWAAMVAWRVIVMLVATGLHANVAASSATLLLSLGVNRLAQAAVIVPRAMGMGAPFAPEKNGKVFMGDSFNRGFGARGGLVDRFGLSGDDDRRGFDGSRDFNGQGGQGTWGSQGGFGGYDGRNGRGAGDRHDARNRRRAMRQQRWGRS